MEIVFTCLIMNAASNNRASLQYCQISEIVLSDSAAPIHIIPTIDPGMGSSAIVVGVLGSLVVLLLAYGVIATIVNVVLMLRIRRCKVSIDQPVYAG